MPNRTPHPPCKPTREQLLAAYGHTVPDVIALRLRVLFCGINPGLYSAATGHHFARPGNRFWPALHTGGFTPRRLYPWEECELLRYGCGVVNIVARGTARADELTPAELQEGARALERKVRAFKPRFLAVLGITAYRLAFRRPKAGLGRQQETIGRAGIWVLPNPSGLNAHHQPATLTRLFRELHEASLA